MLTRKWIIKNNILLLTQCVLPVLFKPKIRAPAIAVRLLLLRLHPEHSSISLLPLWALICSVMFYVLNKIISAMVCFIKKKMCGWLRQEDSKFETRLSYIDNNSENPSNFLTVEEWQKRSTSHYVHHCRRSNGLRVGRETCLSSATPQQLRNQLISLSPFLTWVKWDNCTIVQELSFSSEHSCTSHMESKTLFSSRCRKSSGAVAPPLTQSWCPLCSLQDHYGLGPRN